MLFQDGDIRKELFRCFRELKCFTVQMTVNDTIILELPHAMELGEYVGVRLPENSGIVANVPESDGII